jgi:hypothetical protein
VISKSSCEKSAWRFPIRGVGTDKLLAAPVFKAELLGEAAGALQLTETLEDVLGNREAWVQPRARAWALLREGAFFKPGSSGAYLRPEFLWREMAGMAARDRSRLMRPDTIAALEREFREFPFLKGGEVPLEEITQAAAALDASLPQDHIEFVKRFGGGIVGPYPIFGLRKVAAMGRRFSVVAMTTKTRQQHWPGIDGWVVVSEDHAGNPIGIAPDSKVWVSDHDFGQAVNIAENFEDYLRKRCLGL